MTIYRPMPSFKTKNTSKRLSRKNRRSQDSAYRARVTRSFSEQWKRYPYSKKVLDFRTGVKTHTGIFPEGYDHTYIGPQWHDAPPIKGGPCESSYSGPRVYAAIMNDRQRYLQQKQPTSYLGFTGNSCPGCGKPLGNCLGTSSIYGSHDIGDICEQCFLDEEDLIDAEGTNSPEGSQKIKELLERYRQAA